jgi:hypothetical protein
METEKLPNRSAVAETQWAGRTNEREFHLGQNRVVREKLLRQDSSQIMITSVFVDDASDATLLIDSRFRHFPITLEPGGLLIDQKATTQAWQGNPAGMQPEKALEDSFPSDNILAVPPTNFGWQKGAFMIEDSLPVTLENDSNELSGKYEVIGQVGKKWGVLEVDFVEGRLTPASYGLLLNMRLGFSMPLILKNGRIVSQMSIWERGDPRALADPRNFVDLAAGKKVSDDFWRLVRKFMPTSEAAVRRITREGRYSVSRLEGVSEDDIEAFDGVLGQTGLEKSWQIIKGGQKRPARVIVNGSLPPNRIPLVGIGHDSYGRLIVTVVDGRQKDSTGATIDELAQIMRDRGAVNAGLGAAGGDAFILAKTREGVRLITSPSIVRKEGEIEKRVTRPVPSLLVLG